MTLQKKLQWYRQSTRSVRAKQPSTRRKNRSSAGLGLAAVVPLAAMGLYSNGLAAQCFTSGSQGKYINWESNGGPELFLEEAIGVARASVIGSTTGGNTLSFLATCHEAIYSTGGTQVGCLFGVYNSSIMGTAVTFYGATYGFLRHYGLTSSIDNFPLSSVGTMEIFIGGNTYDLTLSIGSNGSISTMFIDGVLVPNCTALPVELVKIEAEPQSGKGVLISWLTSAEINNSGFEIQRSSDGVHFHKVGWQESKSQSSEGHDYQFMDESTVLNTKYYYRLKQIDHDGKYEYSSTVTATLAGNERYSIGDPYPNPSVRGRSSSIDLRTEVESDVAIELFDAFGQQMASMKSKVEVGFNTLELPTSGLSHGSYFVKVKLEDYVAYKKLVIAE